MPSVAASLKAGGLLGFKVVRGFRVKTLIKTVAGLGTKLHHSTPFDLYFKPHGSIS
ncbi:hypothetical protein CCACVL1_24871 [Corchorus capsularis]|uniref:Uncharacterized protein n=1 Tax=Corchorus capsularis TaxID=210143 RepID=A0A1R3GMN8_COCAP|nr:hypothetical protein CCACVL1_24871 [Corchorus capsularis]